jgi:hypothetical protein
LKYRVRAACYDFGFRVVKLNNIDTVRADKIIYEPIGFRIGFHPYLIRERPPLGLDKPKVCNGKGLVNLNRLPVHVFPHNRREPRPMVDKTHYNAPCRIVVLVVKPYRIAQFIIGLQITRKQYPVGNAPHGV